MRVVLSSVRLTCTHTQSRVRRVRIVVFFIFVELTQSDMWWCCGKDTNKVDRDLEVERARHSKSNSIDVLPSPEEQACNQDNETHKNTDSNQDSTDEQTTHEQRKSRRQSVRMSVM